MASGVPMKSLLLLNDKANVRTSLPFSSSSSSSSCVRFPIYPPPCFLASSSPFSISHSQSYVSVRKVTALAVAEGEVPLPLLQQQSVEKKVKPCQLYVCNLPDNYDVPELQDLFKPFGTVSSLEVSKNAETGLSRGCGYVTMSSFKEAQAAIFALDGSDVGGRELRIRKSAGMKDKLEASNSTPTRNIMFETPHKLYIGNLAWSVKPEDLREHFSQFGTVVSTRVLFDRKTGRNRVYAFLSFSSVEEREAALSSNGTEFSGRTLLVREAIKSSEPSVSTV
ncbi:hypothetical protein GIB67_033342 [Kingdonia uniflora]|uniref:RRM domain-containing protein n=1 Tax=Kingdonia uniflora TaxID=39325 RepID=A0A7J7LTK0_9MAGN|nr:hypothetical protein GIB67_033342 [Kingdonia uniflora]